MMENTAIDAERRLLWAPLSLDLSFIPYLTRPHTPQAGGQRRGGGRRRSDHINAQGRHCGPPEVEGPVPHCEESHSQVRAALFVQ
jgi:hypothetical protein